MFENFRVFETEFAGRKMTFETGKMCCQAGGSVLVRYGETTVLVNATASAKPRDGIDFLPLSVDFEEKLYAVGKIPGSFLKREGRPSDKADPYQPRGRPSHPSAVPQGYAQRCFRCDAPFMSVDPDCVAGNRWYDRRFHGAVHLRHPLEWAHRRHQCRSGGRRDRPQPQCRAAQKSPICSSPWPVPPKRSVMIEAGANEVDDDTMLEAIMTGHCRDAEDGRLHQGNPGRNRQAQVRPSNPGDPDHDMFEAIKDDLHRGCPCCHWIPMTRTSVMSVCARSMTAVHAKFDENIP